MDFPTTDKLIRKRVRLLSVQGNATRKHCNKIIM